MDRIRIVIDDTSLAELENRYGAALTQKALRITNTYVQKVQTQAQDIIAEAGHVDTGRLVNSIKSQVTGSSQKVTGEVYAGSNYARFIHEGAKHDGEKIVPHLVPFKVAPSLLVWAKRNKVIYQKETDGTMRKKRARKGKSWYIMSKRGKGHREYRIDIETGGLMVKQEPVKYFTVPFEKLAPEYLEKMAAAIGEE